MPIEVSQALKKGRGRPKGAKDSVKRKPGTGLHGKQTGGPRIDPEESDLPKITEWASQGKTQKIIASRLGISHTLLTTWMTRSTAVREAWEMGQAVHEDYLDSVLEEVIADPNHKMRVTATFFKLKCQHKWADRSEREIIKTQPRGLARTEVTVVETDPSDRQDFERQMQIQSGDA